MQRLQQQQRHQQLIQQQGNSDSNLEARGLGAVESESGSEDDLSMPTQSATDTDTYTDITDGDIDYDMDYWDSDLSDWPDSDEGEDGSLD
jgi:hypothetical protein